MDRESLSPSSDFARMPLCFRFSYRLVNQGCKLVRNRRILSRNESLTSLAVEAARKALEMADILPDEVDLVLLCTSTPEDLFGGAPHIHKTLGCKSNPLSYDITAACSGFVLGLVSAACHIRGGGFKNVLVIGADALSRYVDWTDRGSCILFGDAAGAVLVQSHLADLLNAEVSKNAELEKQLKVFQGCVARAFAERDNAIIGIHGTEHARVNSICPL